MIPRRTFAVLLLVSSVIAVAGVFVVPDAEPAAAATSLPTPPASYVRVAGCDTGDTASGEPATPVQFVDPAWLATVPDGSRVTLHGSSAALSTYGFYDSVTSTWTGSPRNGDIVGVPQCTAVKQAGALVDPGWSFCINNRINVCSGSVYQPDTNHQVNSVNGTDTPSFVTSTAPLVSDDFAKLNWIVSHNDNSTVSGRGSVTFAIWCISNRIPDAATPGFEIYNGGYVPQKHGSKTTWDHCPIDLSMDKTPQNVLTHNGADRVLSPAYQAMAAHGDGSDLTNNTWTGIDLAPYRVTPTLTVSGPSAPIEVGRPVPFTVSMSGDQVNLAVPTDATATVCAGDATGAVIEGTYLYVAHPDPSGTTSVSVCLTGLSSTGTATLTARVDYVDPAAPPIVRDLAGNICQGLVSPRVRADAATATLVAAPTASSSTTTTTTVSSTTVSTTTVTEAVPTTTVVPDATTTTRPAGGGVRSSESEALAGRSRRAPSPLAVTGSPAGPIALVAFGLALTGVGVLVTRRRPPA